MTAGELEDFNNAAHFRQRGSSFDENPDIDDLQVAGKYNSSIIAKNIGMDLSEFHKLNPGFDKQVLAGNTYTLTLPNDKVAVFTNKKNTILAESVQLLLNTATGTLK
jgi:membrane-bound lytic murein transglycosylase D